LRSNLQGAITDSQWCTVPLVNDLLMIQQGNSREQFLDGTSLSKYDTDTVL